MPTTAYELYADIFKALSHPLRIEVLETLQKGERCFSEVLEQTGGLKSNLSQHLTIMVKKGILKVKKDSRCNYYSLASPKVARAYSLIKDIVMENVKKQNRILELN